MCGADGTEYPCPRCGAQLVPTGESEEEQRGRPGVGPTLYCPRCDPPEPEDTTERPVEPTPGPCPWWSRDGRHRYTEDVDTDPFFRCYCGAVDPASALEERLRRAESERDTAREALRHATGRNHPYSPTGCDGCGEAAAVLDALKDADKDRGER